MVNQERKFKVQKSTAELWIWGGREGCKGQSIGVKMQNGEGSVLKQSVKGKACLGCEQSRGRKAGLPGACLDPLAYKETRQLEAFSDSWGSKVKKGL